MLRTAVVALALHWLTTFPALAWEAYEVERAGEEGCLILPEDSSFAVEMASTASGERRTRIYIPRWRGMPANSRYFIAVADGKGVTTTSGTVEGAPAAALVHAMLDSAQVRLGHSRGLRPLQERHSLSLAGFDEEFWACMRILGWGNNSSGEAEAVRPGPTAPVTGSQSLVTAQIEASDLGPPPPAPSSEIEQYRQLAAQKALALAGDADGPMISGSAHGQTTIEAAVKGALTACNSARLAAQVDAECTVYLVGDAVVGRLPALGAEAGLPPPPEPQPAPAAIQYVTRWVEGRQFVIGTTPGIQVWVTFSTDGGPHAFVYLVNTDDSHHTFLPEEVGVTAVRSTNGGNVLVPMETFTPEAYERKERKKQALIAGLYGVATAFSNRPTPTTSTVHGRTHARVSAFGSGGYAFGDVIGSFSGTITTWPTAEDHANARARTAAQIAAMNAQLQSSFDAMAQSLARSHTLPPDSFYGGIVRFRQQRASQYRLEIPFAGHVFKATFDVR